VGPFPAEGGRRKALLVFFVDRRRHKVWGPIVAAKEAQSIPAEKILDVLTHFVKAETETPPSEAMSPPESPLKYARIGGDWHYVCYPASLERDMGGEITRVWARKVLEDLEERGILTHLPLRPPRRKDSTPHFYLRRDSTAISAAVILLADRLFEDRELFNGFRHQIDEEFVARILHERGHVMHRSLKLWSLGPREMRSRFRSMQHLLGDEDVDLKSYLLKSLRLIYDEGRRDRSVLLDLELKLPVNHPLELDISELESINPTGLGQGEMDDGGAGPIDLISDHYRFHQRAHVILPILYLLSKSPSALMRFVSHPVAHGVGEVDHSFQGTDALNDLIFELLTATISDIVNIGDGDSGGGSVALRPKVEDGCSPLMVISDGTLDIHYDAAFDSSRTRPPGKPGAKAGKPYLDVQTAVSVSPYSGLSLEDIRDFDGLVAEMREGRDPVLRMILESLPNRFRNVVEILGPGSHWCEEHRSDLILYLNLALMDMSIGPQGAELRRPCWGIAGREDSYESLRDNVSMLREMYPEIIRQRQHA